jgi:hypothetical protein
MNDADFLKLMVRFSGLMDVIADAESREERKLINRNLYNVWSQLLHDRFGDPLAPTHSNR